MLLKLRASRSPGLHSPGNPRKARLAQLEERRPAEREVVSSNPGPTLRILKVLGIAVFVMTSANNRPFAGSGHMVRNRLRWDAKSVVGLSKQRKVGLDC